MYYTRTIEDGDAVGRIEIPISRSHIIFNGMAVEWQEPQIFGPNICLDVFVIVRNLCRISTAISLNERVRIRCDGP